MNRLIDALKADRLVTDAQREASRGGRPAQLVRFNAEAQSVLAPTLRSDTVQGAVCDLAGRIRSRPSRPLLDRTHDAESESAAVIEQVIALSAELS
ncbi:hypothetical protein [Streptomyces sp. NPDC021356]|uniref:hypothetical protein n=1 Tax=Streptomyces sp. NPDC021356 TaxID=3154900 RepID=UPI0033DD69FC